MCIRSRQRAWAAEVWGHSKCERKLLIAAHVPEVFAAFIHAFVAIKHHGAVITRVWAVERLKEMLPIGRVKAAAAWGLRGLVAIGMRRRHVGWEFMLIV